MVAHKANGLKLAKLLSCSALSYECSGYCNTADRLCMSLTDRSRRQW